MQEEIITITLSHFEKGVVILETDCDVAFTYFSSLVDTAFITRKIHERISN